MKLYTSEEFAEDIFKMEGVKVKIPISSMFFTKLYSDIYTKRLGNKATVKRLKGRIDDIIYGKFESIIPCVDILPKPGDSFTVYIHKTFVSKFREDLKLEYIKGFDNRRAVDEFLSECREPTVFIIDHEQQTVNWLSKLLH